MTHLASREKKHPCSHSSHNHVPMHQLAISDLWWWERIRRILFIASWLFLQASLLDLPATILQFNKSWQHQVLSHSTLLPVLSDVLSKIVVLKCIPIIQRKNCTVAPIQLQPHKFALACHHECIQMCVCMWRCQGSIEVQKHKQWCLFHHQFLPYQHTSQCTSSKHLNEDSSNLNLANNTKPIGESKTSTRPLPLKFPHSHPEAACIHYPMLALQHACHSNSPMSHFHWCWPQFLHCSKSKKAAIPPPKS